MPLCHNIMPRLNDFGLISWDVIEKYHMVLLLKQAEGNFVLQIKLHLLY